jgi:branched-chain amino acid transport system substrate-binding protein
MPSARPWRPTPAAWSSHGGKVLGSVKHPLNASDFSSFLLQAQNSKAQILGLANAGGDTINAIKAAKEFGVTKTMKLAGLLMFSSDIHSLGLKNTEGLMFTDSWHWDLNPKAASSRIVFQVQEDAHLAAGSQLLGRHAVSEAGREAGHDGCRQDHGRLQGHAAIGLLCQGRDPPDGRYAHDMYLLQVKTPAESKKAWDYFKVLKTLPGDQVFTTKEESKCALWK